MSDRGEMYLRTDGMNQDAPAGPHGAADFGLPIIDVLL
jgi:hypothetical protein